MERNQNNHSVSIGGAQSNVVAESLYISFDSDCASSYHTHLVQSNFAHELIHGFTLVRLEGLAKRLPLSNVVPFARVGRVRRRDAFGLQAWRHKNIH